MGQLVYGTHAATFAFDDRTLAHVELVVLAKLRRNESFALSIETAADGTSGRDTIWLHAGATLQFHYDGERPAINRAWLEALIDTANSSSGMRVVDEPQPVTP